MRTRSLTITQSQSLKAGKTQLESSPHIQSVFLGKSLFLMAGEYLEGCDRDTK